MSRNLGQTGLGLRHDHSLTGRMRGKTPLDLSEEATAPYHTLKNDLEKILCMEPISYFTGMPFWFSTSMALLLTFLVGYRFTGMTGNGKMSQNINFASSENKLKLFSAFIVFEVVFNLAFVFSGSVL